VSDVVATILLLGLTVTLFASIFAFVTTFPTPPAQNNNQFQASLTYFANGSGFVQSIHILHLSGPPVPGTAQVYLKSSTQPTGPEFASPYSISSGLGGANSWNLGQVWNLTFTPAVGLPPANGNITVFIVSQSQLIFDVILPGAGIATPPTVVSTWISPAVPTKAQGFWVYATIAGQYASNSVFVNLAAVPGLPSTAVQMQQNAQGQWYYHATSGATANGTFYGFVNATGAFGQQASGPISITISSTGGSTNGPLSVGVILVPAPPNAGTAEAVYAVITYTGSASGAGLSVTFAGTSSPAGFTYSGSGPSGLSISGPSSVTVASQSTWTIPNPSSATVYTYTVSATATVVGVGTVTGTTAFTPPVLTLSSSGGVIGSSVTATGAAFGASTLVTLSVGGVVATPTGGSSCTHSGSSITTTAAGAFVCIIPIPAGTPFTAATILASDSTTGQNESAPYAVTDWTISPLSATSGVIGASVTVTGTGFAVSSGVTLAFEGIPITVGSCTVGTAGATITTTPAGAFTCVFTIPAGSTGGAVGSLVATDAAGGQTASATFTVSTWTISPLSVTSGVIGTSVTVTGTGFAASSRVTLSFEGVFAITVSSCNVGTAGATIITTPAGAFTCVFTIPTGSDSGAGAVVATDAAGGQTASAPFTVTTWTISPLSVTSGLVGTSVTVTATGFAVSSGVTLVFDGISITVSSCTIGTAGATITTTPAGAFTCVFTIPFTSLPGLGTLVATDATGGQAATATFSVTSWTLTLNRTTGTHSTAQPLTLTGVGFGAGSLVNLYYNGAVVSPTGCSSGTFGGTNVITTTPAGGFVCTYSIATGGTAGTYEFQAIDSTTGQVASAFFIRT